MNFRDPFEAFLFPAVFLALSGAAIAGQKRLASDTYKGLNLSLLFVYTARFLLDAKEVISMPPGGQFLAVISLIACTVGYCRGNSYGKDSPRLLKAFDSS